MFNKKIILSGTLIVFCVLGLSPIYGGYYEDAFNAFKQKNYQEAMIILEEGISAAPNDEQLSFLLGQTYARMNKIDKAIETLKRTVLLDPEIDSAHYLLGQCYTLRRVDGKYKPAWFEASQAYAKAAELNPDKFAYQYNYGHALLQLKKYSDAIAPLQKALELEEGAQDYKTAMELGLAYQLTGQKENAIKYLEKAHELAPNEEDPINYLGKLYSDMQRYDKVTELGRKLVAVKPDSSTGHIFQGVGLYQDKKYSEAVKAFERALQINPKDDFAYFYLGLSQEALLGSSPSSYQSLIDSYGKAVNLAGDSAPSEWHYRLGHAYELESHLDWDRAVRHPEARSRCLRNLQKARSAYQNAGDHETAKERLSIVNERIRQLEVIQ
ncbi:tetratricopeptide repeat protein [bacterium]|nr:tetratricopeptide repeat protein [candidate division CSSED10-310 bacterium]